MTLARAGIAPGDVPLPAQAGDGNDWVEYGDCWLYCRRTGLRVLWLGPVTVPGGVTAPLFGCADCIGHLNDQAWQFARQRDASVPPSDRARHARPRPRRPFWRLPALDRRRKPIDA